jgi:hypothetical protein
MDAADPSLSPCPKCLYPLPDRSPRCPECAYEPTREDWDFKERRVLFLELTRFSSWLVIGSCFAVTAFVSVWALVLQIPWAAAFFVVAKGAPQLHRRLAQRVWMFSLPWLLLPWLVAIGGMRWMSRLWWIQPSWGWKMPWWLSLRDRGLGGIFVPFMIGGLAILAYWFWRFQWRRLARLAGLTSDLARSPAGAISLRLVMLPLLLYAAGVFLIIGVPQLMDVVWPGWTASYLF